MPHLTPPENGHCPTYQSLFTKSTSAPKYMTLPLLKHVTPEKHEDLPKLWAFCAEKVFIQRMKDVYPKTSDTSTNHAPSQRSGQPSDLKKSTLERTSPEPLETKYSASKLPFTRGKKIQKGGEGVVFKGRWNVMKGIFTRSPHVAIKRIKKSKGTKREVSRDKARFELGIRLWLHSYYYASDSVTQLLDVYLDDPEDWYIIMEKAAGDLLSLPRDEKALRKFGLEKGRKLEQPFPEELGKSVFKNVIKGLSLLNGAGIIHRDIKSDNLLYFCSSSSCKVKIADFSLASFSIDDDLLSIRHAGTPEYLPKCMLGEYPPFNRHKKTVDVYGIIATLYDFLEGPPYYLNNPPSFLPATRTGMQAEFYLKRYDEYYGLAMKGERRSEELLAIYSAVLDEDRWESHTLEFFEIAPLLEKWMHSEPRQNPKKDRFMRRVSNYLFS